MRRNLLLRCRTSGTPLPSTDDGFTLIELMVVLLIIAILLAIAIPTFLGARNTANARSTQENLRNALTAEQTNWTSNQTFNVGLSTVEPSLSWTTTTLTTKGGNSVLIGLYSETVTLSSFSAGTVAEAASGSTTYDGVVVVGAGKDNNCYAIYQSNNAVKDFTGYTEWADPSTGCAIPAPPGGAPNAGSAAANPGSTAGAFWYSSF